jgi:hypothetical protein
MMVTPLLLLVSELREQLVVKRNILSAFRGNNSEIVEILI